MKWFILRIAGFAPFGALLPSVAAAAAETAANPNEADIGETIPSVPNTSMAGYLIWVIFALLLVTCLIVLVIRWLAQRNRLMGTNRALRTLGGIPLGQNKSLQVVELSGRVYIVGVGESISLLDKIEDPQEARAILQSLEQQQLAPWAPASFKDWFDKLRNRGKEEPNTWEEADSFQTMLQSKLKKQSDQRHRAESLLQEENHNDRLMDE